MADPQPRLDLLAQRVYPGGKLLRAWDLQGGVSAQVTALEIARPDGSVRKVVVRRHGPADLRANPNIAQDEFALLQIVRAAGLPAPAPYYLDKSGELLGAPCLVVEYIDGKTEFAPPDLSGALAQMAEQLSNIHGITPASVDLSFLPRQRDIYANKLGRRPADLDDSLSEGPTRDVLESAWPFPSANPDALLHGDYWPGNILWKDERIVGIIDWEDARVGDPLEDLANSRLEIMWAFGLEAMQSFTDLYVTLTHIDLANLPYWDLCAALRPAHRLSEWAVDATVETKMRDGHARFVAQAMRNIPR
jgi:aminoglycoside phosphotransferase (APT) family kinase protein